MQRKQPSGISTLHISYQVNILLLKSTSGASCAVAGAVLNPVDVVKIRMMNDSPLFPWPEKSIWSSLRRVTAEEGIAGHCRGLTATVMRE